MRKKIKTRTNKEEQRLFIMLYFDCLESDLLADPYEVTLYMALKKFAGSSNQCFPSLQALADEAKMSKRKAQKTLKELEKKHIISIQNRTNAKGGKTSNLYIVYDFKELWEANSDEEAAAAVEAYREKKMIEELRAKGYKVTLEEETTPDNATVKEEVVAVMEEPAVEEETTVMAEPVVEEPIVSEEVAITEEPIIEESPIVTEEMVAEEEPATATEETVVSENITENVDIKEKALVSGNVQITDTSTNITKLLSFSNKDNTTQTKESQPLPLEKYSLDWIKQRFDYDILLHNNPYNKDDIDCVMDVLYTNLNTTKKTIRIDSEDKPTNVVIGKLMKLQYWDIEHAIEKFKEQKNRIRHPLSYLLTILYHAPEQNHLDVQNLVNYNMYGDGRLEEQPKPQDNFDQNRSKNQFHQFHQRDVTQEELDELERKLLSNNW